MEINYHEDRKLVDVWISHEDQASQGLQMRLRKIYREYAEKKYTVVVFCSGQKDLAEETSELLQKHRKRSAEWDVQREKAQRQRECR